MDDSRCGGQRRAANRLCDLRSGSSVKLTIHNGGLKTHPVRVPPPPGRTGQPHNLHLTRLQAARSRRARDRSRINLGSWTAHAAEIIGHSAVQVAMHSAADIHARRRNMP
jgi:hypothetical protein